MNLLKLSVIIPAYNEEKRIPKTLDAIDSYFKNQNYGYEIIVSDGGSSDRTPEIVLEKAKNIKNLKLVRARNCKGKGGAVKAGMTAAQGDFRVFTDADNSTSIDQVEKMWPEVEAGFGVVIGSRDVKGAILDPPQPWLRKIILGDGFKLYRKIIIGLWGIEDTQCGFKGFSKEAALKVFPKAKIEGWAFDPEVLVLAKREGFKIKEIPVSWKNDLDSKVKPTAILEMAADLLRIKWNLITKKYN
jgi:dolichyl-phosphate beta-glucosyltransferase